MFETSLLDANIVLLIYSILRQFCKGVRLMSNRNRNICPMAWILSIISVLLIGDMFQTYTIVISASTKILTEFLTLGIFTK